MGKYDNNPQFHKQSSSPSYRIIFYSILIFSRISFPTLVRYQSQKRNFADEQIKNKMLKGRIYEHSCQKSCTFVGS